MPELYKSSLNRGVRWRKENDRQHDVLLRSDGRTWKNHEIIARVILDGYMRKEKQRRGVGISSRWWVGGRLRAMAGTRKIEFEQLGVRCKEKTSKYWTRMVETYQEVRERKNKHNWRSDDTAASARLPERDTLLWANLGRTGLQTAW